MASRPPLSDALIVAVAHLVDDAQTVRREPSHNDVEFQIDKVGLSSADPAKHSSKPIGKSKRVRGALSWALENNPLAGEALVVGLVATIQGYGGFRSTSGNYCGAEAVANLTSVLAAVGWELSADGSMQPRILDSLRGSALTGALLAYAERARKGAMDSPLLTGTAKDLLEAVAAHVIVQRWHMDPGLSNFPTLLGQAFTALGFATPTDPIVSSEPARRRVERAAYELGCAVNALRNKEGTGHGHPWMSTVTPSQARFAIESMGGISVLMLEAL